jgi:hypothetical protein
MAPLELSNICELPGAFNGPKQKSKLKGFGGFPSFGCTK